MSRQRWNDERERLLGVLARFERGDRAFDADERGELTRDVTYQRLASVKRQIVRLNEKLASE